MKNEDYFISIMVCFSITEAAVLFFPVKDIKFNIFYIHFHQLALLLDVLRLVYLTDIKFTIPLFQYSYGDNIVQSSGL
jgi:hypothetical protein